MAFYFVDRIYELERGKYARGLKNVTRNESFFYWLPTGERLLSPAVITEALAQLGAWLKMATVDFKKRPVLLADELTTYHGWAEVGDQIDLHVKILEFEDDVVLTTSYAEIRGKKILQTKCCRGYMLPMEEFDDREKVMRQFKNIYRPEFANVSRVEEPSVRVSAIAGTQVLESLRFIDGIVEHVPYKKVIGFKNFASCEPYFETHFPYKPVAPGVMLMTFMGEVCQYLIRENINCPVRSKALIPTFVQNARFRKFVEPGDQCVLIAEVKEGDATRDDSDILVSATIMANDKRVLNGEMGFRTMFGPTSQALKNLMAHNPNEGR